MDKPVPITVLCIDDDAETLGLRRQVLQMYGYNVITASSGIDGLRLLSSDPTVDLVLLDYLMPGMTGGSVAEELKKLHPTTPIVLISGFPEIPEAVLAMVDGYVEKGQDPEAVIGAIRSVLAPKQRSS